MGQGRHTDESRRNMRIGQRKRQGWARDYGELHVLNVWLAADQLRRLPKRPSMTEHVRRALDLYLLHLGRGVR